VRRTDDIPAVPDGGPVFRAHHSNGGRVHEDRDVSVELHYSVRNCFHIWYSDDQFVLSIYHVSKKLHRFIVAVTSSNQALF